MDALAFFSGITDGSVSLKDAGQLHAADVFAIARVGAAALQGGRFAQAEQVFVALAALEPKERAHWLHVAAARHGAGNVDGAVSALGEFLARADGVDDEDVARALLLRAELAGRTNVDLARGDLGRARALTSAPAKKLVDAALGVATVAGGRA